MKDKVFETTIKDGVIRLCPDSTGEGFCPFPLEVIECEYLRGYFDGCDAERKNRKCDCRRDGLSLAHWIIYMTSAVGLYYVIEFVLGLVGI